MSILTPAEPTAALGADGFADVPLDGSPVQRSNPRIAEAPQALPAIPFRGVTCRMLMPRLTISRS